jgi:hypothetical protein
MNDSKEIKNKLKNNNETLHKNNFINIYKS